MRDRSEDASGPVEDFRGPDQLTGRVVDPGPPPRIHGYELEGDLCQHYGFAEVVLLLLTGELPRAAQARAFETILVWWSGASVRDAPVHAAVLARLCGASVSGTLAVGTIGLCAEAGARAGGAQELETWWREGGELPEPLRAQSDRERDATGRLRDVILACGFSHPVFEEDPTPMVAARSVLHACGLRSAEQQAAVWCLARIPALAAEAAAAKPGELGQYPLRLPGFHYTSPQETDDEG